MVHRASRLASNSPAKPPRPVSTSERRVVSTQFRIRSTARSPAAMSTPAAAYALGSSVTRPSLSPSAEVESRFAQADSPAGTEASSEEVERESSASGASGFASRAREGGWLRRWLPARSVDERAQYGRVRASAAPTPAVIGWRSSTSTGVAPSEAASSSTYLPSRALSGSSTG